MTLRLEVLTPQARALAPGLCALAARAGYVMAGGTALALQLGHRVSVDFDCFVTSPTLSGPSNEALAALGTVEPLQNTATTREAVVAGVKCSFFAYPYPFSPPQIDCYGLPLATPEDIGAMKLIAIVQRGAKKDFADLYALLQALAFGDIVANLRRRVPADRLNAVQIAKALMYFDDAERDPDPTWIGAAPAWNDVKAFFATRIRTWANVLSDSLTS